MRDFFETEIILSNGIKFRVITNIPRNKDNVNTMQAAIDSWLSRTDTYTDRSFVDYINSKGMHKAYTIDEYDTIISDLLSKTKGFSKRD